MVKVAGTMHFPRCDRITRVQILDEHIQKNKSRHANGLRILKNPPECHLHISVLKTDLNWVYSFYKIL